MTDKGPLTPTEKIFMIEVAVQKVHIALEVNDLAFRNAETCLSYRFLDFGPFNICDRDFQCRDKDGGCAGCNALKNGSSAMFPAFPDQIDALKKDGFQLDVTVLKLMTPEPVTIGTTEVPMKNIFIAVLDDMEKKKKEAISKSMKRRFKLMAEDEKTVGYVDLFVRFSSMGKIIVTTFQMNTARRNMQYHSSAGHTYTYRKKPTHDPAICGPCGKPGKFKSPYENVMPMPKDYPEFKITPDARKRLLSKRYKELGIEEPVEEPSKPPPPPPTPAESEPAPAGGEPEEEQESE